ncbi:MAG: hypothetical protein JO232_08405 [Verrucomicrobia bacterium]|nr:hypothetical protein [Verrucomicrobiota bacterium]
MSSIHGSSAIRTHVWPRLPAQLLPSFSTKDQPGAGLGLNTVFGIVQRHHGAVDIESESGKGTTFTLRFPMASYPSFPCLNPISG